MTIDTGTSCLEEFHTGFVVAEKGFFHIATSNLIRKIGNSDIKKFNEKEIHWI